MPTEILTDNTDIFLARDETFDGVEDILGPSFFILLRNFPLNSHTLLPAHVEILRERVAPYIKRPAGFAEIYGMTDRSGSRQVNYKVGAERVAAVQKGLQVFGPPFAKFHHAFVKSIGEDFFESREKTTPGTDNVFGDGVKNGEFRLVVIALTPAPIGVPTRLFRFRPAANTVGFCRSHRQTN